jgi:hypothetical protein
MAILDLNQEPDEGDGEELPDLNDALREDFDDAQGENQNIPVNQEHEQATGTLTTVFLFTYFCITWQGNSQGSPSCMLYVVEAATEPDEIHSEDDLQAIYDAMMQEEDGTHDGKSCQPRR